MALKKLPANSEVSEQRVAWQQTQSTASIPARSCRLQTQSRYLLEDDVLPARRLCAPGVQQEGIGRGFRSGLRSHSLAEKYRCSPRQAPAAGSLAMAPAAGSND
ncbi:hypothetical protein LNP74_05205 [Klebsiella pneumoniae subsp. pneumoniae]|nr:hypothetical protein [Klebsiella pneumoniae subsp. pneumoniae]